MIDWVLLWMLSWRFRRRKKSFYCGKIPSQKECRRKGRKEGTLELAVERFRWKKNYCVLIVALISRMKSCLAFKEFGILSWERGAPSAGTISKELSNRRFRVWMPLNYRFFVLRMRKNGSRFCWSTNCSTCERWKPKKKRFTTIRCVHLLSTPPRHSVFMWCEFAFAFTSPAPSSAYKVAFFDSSAE